MCGVSDPEAWSGTDPEARIRLTIISSSPPVFSATGLGKAR